MTIANKLNIGTGILAAALIGWAARPQGSSLQ